jgi:hypothetical protein
MTRREVDQQQVVIRQDGFGVAVGGEDWVEIGIAPRIHVVKEKERRARDPLSFTELAEFLECPACSQVRTAEGRRFRIPETEKMLVSSMHGDLAVCSHTLTDREHIKFHSPLTLLNYMQYIYPQRLRTLPDGKVVIGFLKKKKGGELEDTELGQFVMEVASEAMVRYYLINYWTIIESQKKLVKFKLDSPEGEIPMTVMIDQIRNIPIGELKKKTKDRNRTFERQIFGLKMKIGKERLRLSLQTGIQLLAYQSLHPRRELPEIVVYDFATGRKLVRRGGDESLLIEGIVCARKAMHLGFDEPNPSHKHYAQLGKRPKSHMEAGSEYKEVMAEGKGWYLQAKQAFGAYDESCTWEEVPSPVFVRREDGRFIIHPLKGKCPDCGGVFQMDLNGAIYCSIEGEERRFGRFPKDAEKVGLGGYLTSSN